MTIQTFSLARERGKSDLRERAFDADFVAIRPQADAGLDAGLDARVDSMGNDAKIRLPHGPVAQQDRAQDS